jgi:hypothetical protein
MVPQRTPSSNISVSLVLVLVTMVALAVRLGWLWFLARPEDIGLDPDGYWRAARLLVRSGEWRWTFSAVRYPYQGHDYLLPPLYPAFLSIFQLHALPQEAALVVQAFLSAACSPLLFVIARRAHSERAGFIAALIWAIWAPSILSSMFFMQEGLHVPLLIAGFAALPPLVESASTLRFFIAGGLLGCAALVRSMPMYFMPVASAFLLWVRWPPKIAGPCVLALLGGFLAAAGPYSLSASYHNARVVLIENHGAITAGEYLGVEQGGGSPDASAAIQTYVEGVFESPAGFVSTWWRFVRSLAYVSGGRVLETYVSTPTRAMGLLAKGMVHFAADFLFIGCLILAPFGVVLARRRADTSLLALWVLLAAVLTGLAAHGGARYRSPLEPFLIVLASVVLAGDWRRVTRRPLVGATVASLLMMWLVLPQIPTALAGHPEYGVMERHVVGGHPQLVVANEAGIHVTPSNGRIQFELAAAFSGARPLNVDIRVDGVRVATADIVPGVPQDFDYLWKQPGTAFLEVSTPGIVGQSLRVTSKAGVPGPQ